MTGSNDLLLVLGYQNYGKVNEVLQAIRVSYPTIKPFLVINAGDADYSEVLPLSQILKSSNVNRNHEELCLEIERQVLSLSKKPNICSVVNFQDYMWPADLDICRHFNIAGAVPPEVIEKTAIKANFRYLTRNEYFGLSYKLINCLSDDLESILQIAKQLGEIVVIKPIAGGGSNAVSKFYSYDKLALEQAVRNAQEFQKDMYGDTTCYLMEIDCLARIRDYILMEAYLPGYEYSMEGYADNIGRAVYCVAQQKLNSQETPCFRDFLYQVPPCTELVKQQETVDDVLSKLNYKNWPYHIELREDENGGFKVVEVNPRVGGGSIDLLLEAIHGTSVVRFAVSHLMQRIYSKRYYVTTVIHAHQSGKLVQYRGLEQVRAHPACVFVKELEACGKSLSQSDLMRESYLIEFCVVGNTSDQANEIAQRLAEIIEVSIEPF
jgi:hypothetical protein